MSRDIINNKNFNIVMVVLIIATFIIFNYEYRTALLVGFIAAVLTYPIVKILVKYFGFLLKSYARPLSAIFTIVITTVLTFVLVNLLASQIVREVPKLIDGAYDTVNSLPSNESFVENVGQFGISKEFISSRVEEFNNFTRPVVYGDSFNIESFLNQKNINRTLTVGQQILNLIFNQIVYIILFFLAWYNALVFGGKWLGAIFTILPFKTQERKVVIRDLEIGVRNVIYANILSGLIHTVAAFLMMIVFGVENIFVISLIVFLIGFLPASPSEIGYAIPITIIFTQNPIAAVFLAVFAELLIIWVNYGFLPKIILAGNEGNPLFVVTSVLVGIQIFGLMGFIIGPVIMIFVNTLAQILLKRINHDETM